MTSCASIDLADFNHRFQVQAAERGTAFVPTTSRNPDRVFSLQFESLQFERRVNQDNTISCRNHTLQIAPARYLAAPQPYTSTWMEPGASLGDR
jgi:hypothetical protein